MMGWDMAMLVIVVLVILFLLGRDRR